jgi:regulatory protein
MKLHPESERLFQTDEEVEKAKKAAFKLLGGRAYTHHQMVKKLDGRGFQRSVIDLTLKALTDLKLIDDVDFAHRFAREKMRLRPMGRAMLARDLKKRGIADEDLIQEVLDEAFSGVDTEELALDLLRGRKSRYAGLERRKALSRMYGFLGRRGFSGSDTREAVERAWVEFIENGEEIS